MDTMIWILQELGLYQPLVGLITGMIVITVVVYFVKRA